MNTPAQNWLSDLSIANPDLHDIAHALRQLILASAKNAQEEIKYGGILFSAPEPICGIFAYRAHVSLEFVTGAGLPDPHGALEGRGKYRRHIKLNHITDIENKHVADAVRLALEVMASQ